MKQCVLARIFYALVFSGVFSLSVSANVLEQMMSPTDRDIPEFALADINGEPITTESLKGKTWLINFWAVWCGPCVEELPDLNSAWEQLKDENVGMLAINITEQPHQIEAFFAKHNLTIDFPIIMGQKTNILRDWGGVGLPYTVLVSSEGKVVYEATGPRSWHEPAFVNAVLEVRDTAPPESKAFSSFHQMLLWQKALLIALLVVGVIGLMFGIRRLAKPSSSAQS